MERKMPIRVLQVIGAMNFGGAESMIMNIYRKLNKSTIQFDFLVHTEKECSYDQEIYNLGGNIFRIRRFNGANAITYYHDCMRFFDSHPEIAVVHGHIGSCASMYLKAAKNHGCYTIAHSHSVGEYTSLKDYVYAAYSYPTRYISDYLMGCSTEAGISRYGKKVVQENNKYCNFPNAIDLEKFLFNEEIRKSMRDNFSVTNKELLIGTIGRIVDAKNPEFIFELFQRLVQIPNVKCLWVGYGTLEETFKKKVLMSGLSDKVIMLGKRSDVVNILQALDCFILPSKYEGLPVSAIEAQTTGLPCILSQNITKETEVTNLVSWLPIGNLDTWEHIVIEQAKKYLYARHSPIDQIRRNGYDINTSVKWLEDFYIKHGK